MFSTSGLAERAFPQMKKELEDTVIPVADEDFYCRGQFTALHRGHPDKDDLARAEKFAKKWMEE